jgi:hypothetical protein
MFNNLTINCNDYFFTGMGFDFLNSKLLFQDFTTIGTPHYNRFGIADLICCQNHRLSNQKWAQNNPDYWTRYCQRNPDIANALVAADRVGIAHHLDIQMSIQDIGFIWL